MTDKSNFNFKAIMVSAIVSTAFTIIGALAISFLSNKAPALQYEILPVSYFKRDSIQLSIINIKVLNSGEKECEDVAMNIDFGSKIKPNDYSIQKSSSSIGIKQKFDSTTGKISYSTPYLNPKEQIVFTFLLNEVIDYKNVQVDLRSKGLNGEQIVLLDETLGIPYVLILGTIGMFVMAIVFTSVVVFHQRKVIKYERQLQKLDKAEINKLKKELEKN